jgi:hypothetical protein
VALTETGSTFARDGFEAIVEEVSPSHLIGRGEQSRVNERAYFYDDRNRGVLFREMMKLIGQSPRSKIEGLRAFQARGWLLVDATYEPVNKCDDEAKRNAIILRDYPRLIADLTQLTPERTVPIILIKKNVCELLESGFLTLIQSGDGPDRWGTARRSIRRFFPDLRLGRVGSSEQCPRSPITPSAPRC